MKGVLKIYFSVLIIFVSWHLLKIYSVYQSTDDHTVTTTYLIKKHGYPAKSYTVQTDDGYLLTLHRIPYGKDGKKGKRPVVFLQHGLMSNSGSYVATGPDKSLAFLLADRGCDVWLGNVRGNRYGLRHIKYDPSHQEFWNFSLNHHSFIDYRAQMDFVLNKTEKENIYWVGHSMGAALVLTLIMEMPEYSEKTKHIFALAPPVFVDEMKNILSISFISGIYPKIMLPFGEQPSIPSPLQYILVNGWKLCHSDLLTNFICKMMYDYGGSENHGNATKYSTIFGAGVSLTSLKVLRHINLALKYQMPIYPESGEIRSLTCGEGKLPPITAWYSDADHLVDSKNAEKWKKCFPNSIVHVISNKSFNHFDYAFGENAVDIVYSEIFRIIKSTEENHSEETIKP